AAVSIHGPRGLDVEALEVEPRRPRDRAKREEKAGLDGGEQQVLGAPRVAGAVVLRRRGRLKRGERSFGEVPRGRRAADETHTIAMWERRHLGLRARGVTGCDSK